MDQDLKAARKLQKVLLPREADIRGLDIAIRSRAAREISGDVYEFFEQGDEYAVIAFGDVSGKGAAAALYGALISGLLRILTPRRRSPAMLMQSLNEALLERKVDAVYATLMVLLWEPRTHRMTISNAGAEPLLISRGGEIITAKAEGVPIGLLEHQTYDEVSLSGGIRRYAAAVLRWRRRSVERRRRTLWAVARPAAVDQARQRNAARDRGSDLHSSWMIFARAWR